MSFGAPQQILQRSYPVVAFDRDVCLNVMQMEIRYAAQAERHMVPACLALANSPLELGDLQRLGTLFRCRMQRGNAVELFMHVRRLRRVCKALRLVPPRECGEARTTLRA
jgi:hypothetical protein